jgi:hypothetical protein
VSTVTPDQGIIIPVGSDAANNPQAFTDMIAGVESRLVLRYPTLAQRTALHLAPVEGQISDLAAENRMDAYDGASWISQSTRGLYARRVRTTNAAAINNNTILANDAVLQVPIDVTGTFRFYGRIYYDSSIIADLKMAFTWPAASGAKWGLAGREVGTATNFSATVATGSGSALAVGGNAVGTNTFCMFDGVLTISATGTFIAQFAQNTLDPTNTTVQSGSWLEMLKVS